MGRVPKKKGECGIATTFISRKQALKKLQLSLKDFRRLCIVKGIYPQEPKHKRKASKNSSTNKTYYTCKDIQFLAHEPLIENFRLHRIFGRKLKRAIDKKDPEACKKLQKNEPTYSLHHIVQERYPNFIDAIRDLDDALSMCCLFSTFPKSRAVNSELVYLSRRLIVEFMHYIIASQSLRKVFISIKGFYFQAEIMGELVTWIVPHQLGYQSPTDVDFKVMVTFADFYTTLLGCVNRRLYHTLNILYPPKLAVESPSGKDLLNGEEGSLEYLAALNIDLKGDVKDNEEEEIPIDEIPELYDEEKLDEVKVEAQKIQKQKKLFENCKIFINREVPREVVVFIIRSFGGQVSFDKNLYVGATFDEDDTTITHELVDRPKILQTHLNRYYVQPQWIFDSVNARMLLPMEPYFPGAMLPVHLCPFVEEGEGDYVPQAKQLLLEMQKGNMTGFRKKEVDSEDEEDEEDIVFSEIEDDQESHEISDKGKSKEAKDKGVIGNVELNAPKTKKSKDKVREVLEDKRKSAKPSSEIIAQEEKKLAIVSMSKKNKHLYDKIIYGQKRKNRENRELLAKRDAYKKEQKKLKLRKNK